MSVITEISKQKKGNRFNVFVDGQFTVGVSQNTLAEFGLYKEKDFTNISLEEIIKFDFYNAILEKAVRLVSSSPKTVKALKSTLILESRKRQLDYSVEIDSNTVVEDVLGKLLEMGYLNDLRYATEFINSRINNRIRSKELIKSELITKGVEKSIIEEALSLVVIDENENARELLIKKYGSAVIGKVDNKKINFLRGKGYNWDVISKFIKDDFEE